MLTKIKGFTTFTLTITRIPNKSFIAYAFIAFTPAFIMIPTLVIITNTTVNLHLRSMHYILCHSMRLVSLVPNTRLNTLSFLQHQEHIILRMDY